MTTTAMRQELQNYLQVAEDKKVKAIYVMMEDEIKASASEYTEEFKAELDRRVAYCMNGGKTVTPEEMENRLQQIRKKNRK